MEIPINISVRHVHLSREHVEALFGPNYELTPQAELSQPGQFACQETVTVRGPKSSIARVRVLGPERKETQVEVSRTDEFTLGVDAPVRASGLLFDTPGVRILGPAGNVDLDHGVIQAQRHIHMTPADAESLGVEDQDKVMVRVGGERGVIFDDVLVRVSDRYRLDMHIDSDEGNAANLGPGATGILIKNKTEVAPNPDD